MSGFTLSLFLDRLRPEQLTSNQMSHSVSSFSCVPWDPKKVQVGNDQEKAQSEKNALQIPRWEKTKLLSVNFQLERD